MAFPILYGTDKNGKTKMWSATISSSSSSNEATVTITFGQVDGKHQTATRVYTEGKNIGKKNETTPLQQCINETQRKWQDKKEKEGYLEESEFQHENEQEIKNNDEKNDEKNEKRFPIFPMLAHTYEPLTEKRKKNDIAFPCFVQPKLDGLRCIAYLRDGIVRFQSRTGSYFETLSHLSDALSRMFETYPDEILDGELYTSDIPFEELAGLIKKKKISPSDSDRLKDVHYHIYDVVNEQPFHQRDQRISLLTKMFPSPYLQKVDTFLADDVSHFRQYFAKFVKNGYEGIMLRNVDGIYRTDYRSHDLQKYKEFFEDEFQIIGFKEGDGRDKGTVIWVCKTDDGKEFSVRPRGTVALRTELYQNAREWVGGKLTVIYQERMESGIPRFPVGKSVRDNF